MVKRLTPIQAIRKHCLECAGGPSGAKDCGGNDCPLYPFRLGKNEARRGIGGNPHLQRATNI